MGPKAKKLSLLYMKYTKIKKKPHKNCKSIQTQNIHNLSNHPSPMHKIYKRRLTARQENKQPSPKITQKVQFDPMNRLFLTIETHFYSFPAMVSRKDEAGSFLAPFPFPPWERSLPI